MMEKFIDIHAHCIIEKTCPCGLYTSATQPLHTPDELIRRYDEIGVEKGCILPEANPEALFFTQSNEEVLRIVRQHPDRFAAYCNIDPRNCHNRPNAPFKDVLAYYKDKGCLGVGEVCANIHITDPRMQNLFAAAEANDMSVTFHLSTYRGYLYGLVDDAGLPGLELTLQRFPKLKVFGHSQTFWAEIGRYDGPGARFGYPKGKVVEVPLEGRNDGAYPQGRLVALFRKYPNLYGDLSAGSGANAIMRDREFGIRFMNEFQDRLMFGLDLCAVGMKEPPLAAYLRQLVAEKAISETIFNKIARENAIRITGVKA